MSKTVRYLLMVLLILAMGIWLITVYRSCEAAKAQNAKIEQEDGKAVLEEYVDSANETDGEGDSETDSEGLGEGDGEGDGGIEDEGTETDNEEDKEPAGTIDEYEGVAGGGRGEYLVVAGAYVSKSNAMKTLKRLQKAGYSADVRVFLGSDYHSVVLGNYATPTEARDVAKKMRSSADTKDAYVHKKRYLKKRK